MLQYVFGISSPWDGVDIVVAGVTLDEILAASKTDGTETSDGDKLTLITQPS
jgi:hypothetical protein